jgi:biopolymer transport protein ExbD
MHLLTKTFILFSILSFTACAEDCSDCQKKLFYCMNSPSIPVDLPNSSEPDYGYDENILEVGVTADNEFVLDSILYEYDAVLPLLENWLDSTAGKDQKLKISGDTEADYGEVFRLIAFAKQHEIKPILVFKNS